MAKIAVKSTDGSVQITDTLTGVVRTIPKGDKWHITQTTDYSTLYWYDDAEVVIYANGSEPGNSIFGASTPATLLSAIVSGSIESSSGGGGAAVSGRPIDVSQGLDASVDLEDIKNNVSASLVTLNQIKAELVNSKSIADLIIEDAVGNYYVRQESTDQTTGIISVTLFNLDGSAASPVPVLPLFPVKTKESSVVVEEDYVSLTAGVGRSIGDEISIVKILSPTTGNILNTLYFNITTNSTLAVITPVNTELKSLDDSDNEILDGLWNARNRFSVNYYRAITDDLVNNYWVKGDTIQLAFTEQKGVSVSNFSNLSSFVMPNLAIGAVGAPIPGSSIRHLNELLTEVKSRIRITTTSGLFVAGSVYLRIRFTSYTGQVRFDLYYNENTGSAISGAPTLGTFSFEQVEATIGSILPNNSATNSSTVSGRFVAAPPTLLDGQMVPLQLSNNGSLKVTEPNQTLALSSFSKVTDGVNTASVKPASTSPGLTDPSLVVSISGNSSTYGSLIPNVTATRAETVAGIFNTVAPVLTNGQMVPLQLNSSGSLKTIETTPVTTRIGQINPAADTAITANTRVRNMNLTNTSGVVIFFQIFSSAVALTTGAIPLNGLVYRIPVNSSLSFGVADLGEAGTLYAANTRIGLSSTFGTYTASIAGTLALCSLSIELI